MYIHTYIIITCARWKVWNFETSWELTGKSGFQNVRYHTCIYLYIYIHKNAIITYNYFLYTLKGHFCDVLIIWRDNRDFRMEDIIWIYLYIYLFIYTRNNYLCTLKRMLSRNILRIDREIGVSECDISYIYVRNIYSCMYIHVYI